MSHRLTTDELLMELYHNARNCGSNTQPGNAERVQELYDELIIRNLSDQDTARLLAIITEYPLAFPPGVT